MGRNRCCQENWLEIKTFADGGRWTSPRGVVFKTFKAFAIRLNVHDFYSAWGGLFWAIASYLLHHGSEDESALPVSAVLLDVQCPLGHDHRLARRLGNFLVIGVCQVHENHSCISGADVNHGVDGSQQ